MVFQMNASLLTFIRYVVRLQWVIAIVYYTLLMLLLSVKFLLFNSVKYDVCLTPADLWAMPPLPRRWHLKQSINTGVVDIGQWIVTEDVEIGNREGYSPKLIREFGEHCETTQ